MAATAQFCEITLDPQLIGGAWKLYHYEPGTSTLKNVWTDRAKGATAAQPVVADANGTVSFYGDGLYDLVVYNSADVLKYTWDDVYIVEQATLGSEGSSITSASPLVLSATASEIYAHVTGTTTVSSLSGTQAFAILTFDSALTLTDGSSFQLRNRVSRVTRADETVMFVNDGAGVWREVAPPLRLQNNVYLTSRNAAGSAEINAIKINGSNLLEFGVAVVSPTLTTPTITSPTITGYGAGALVLIETITAAASATVDFDSGIDSTYGNYVVMMTDVIPTTNGDSLWMRVSQDGGSTWKSDAAAYGYGFANNDDAGAAASGGDVSDSEIEISNSLSSTASKPLCATVTAYGLPNATTNKMFRADVVQSPNAIVLRLRTTCGAFILNQAAVNGLRFLCSTDTIASGIFSLYGVRKA